ncbi:rna-directed dna polymerase from mobile element jockey-like [Pitangus sulphuratus]|nr:rna-directed dna polymerase from mobile element jockey-like [Pitangus sulphuratus]
MQDNQGIRPRHHGFIKGRLIDLISFYDQVTYLVDERKVLNAVKLDFSKAFGTVSHSILRKKLVAHSLEGRRVRWVKNWVKGWVQTVVMINPVGGQS